MKFDKLIKTVLTKHFPAHPAPTGLWESTQQRLNGRLPEEMKEFFLAANGVSLFEKDDPPYRIVSLSEIRPTSYDISGEDPSETGTENWLTIADAGNDNYVSMHPLKNGHYLFIDSFHETFAEPGYSTVIAQSFSEFLEKCLKSKEGVFWLEDSFVGYGDAYKFEGVNKPKLSSRSNFEVSPKAHYKSSDIYGNVPILLPHERQSAIVEVLRRCNPYASVPYLSLGSGSVLFVTEIPNGQVQIEVRIREPGDYMGELYDEMTSTFIIGKRGEVLSGSRVHWKSRTMERGRSSTTVSLELVREFVVDEAELDRIFHELSCISPKDEPDKPTPTKESAKRKNSTIKSVPKKSKRPKKLGKKEK